MPLLMNDASLVRQDALPNGAATINGTSIDLKCKEGDFLHLLEILVSAPALTTGEIGDGQTITYKLQHSDDNATFVDLYLNLFVQTGAGGAGCAAGSKQVRLPLGVKRYLRASATKTGASNASTSKVTCKPVF